MSRDIIAVCIGAIVALLLQIVLSPNIAIGAAMPNFCIVFVLIVAILRPAGNSALVLAFLLGLVFDLLGNGPVGVTPFLLVLVTFAAQRVFLILNNDTFFMPIVVLIAAVFLLEFLYAAFMITFGITTNIVEAFVFRALGCGVYDCVVGAILYPIGLRLFAASSTGLSVGGSSRPSMHVSMTSNKDYGKLRSKSRRF